jgi:hypothetical protein
MTNQQKEAKARSMLDIALAKLAELDLITPEQDRVIWEKFEEADLLLKVSIANAAVGTVERTVWLRTMTRDNGHCGQ